MNGLRDHAMVRCLLRRRTTRTHRHRYGAGSTMSEHPYVVPDYTKCRSCGCSRYLRNGRLLHYATGTEQCATQGTP